MCLLNNLTFALDKVLSLPPLSSSYIKCTPITDNSDGEAIVYLPSNLPFENGPLIHSTVHSAKLLSEGKDVKTVVELVLDIDDHPMDYLPGDTIGIFPHNAEEDVNFLLEKLQFTENSIFKIELDKSVPKKKSALPPHIPHVASIKVLFRECLDLRAVIKKAFLRSLVNYTSDSSEKRRLQELCSREGSLEYNNAILNYKSSIIDVLKAFTTCQPSLSVLLEHLPRLQPRVYSIASSPLEYQNKLRIVFNVVFDSRNRRGICSGWLYDVTHSLHDISNKLSNLRLDDNVVSVKIPIYLRKHSTFRIPDNPLIPLIMIGPGTGVAPFIGFLKHRKNQLVKNNQSQSNWLFFGCRYPKRDELYSEFLCELEKEGLLNYSVCYSRAIKEEHGPKYVQDLLLQKQYEIVHQLLSTDTRIFICGDGLGMGKEVVEALITCLKNVQGISVEEAKVKVTELEKSGRISKDLWL